MHRPLRPVSVQKIGSELAIAWNDGRESFLSLVQMRRKCPCAACGGEPDVMGNVERPDVTHGPGSFELMSWQTVGGYALQPRWGDGHNSGIYSYSYLRDLDNPDR